MSEKKEGESLHGFFPVWILSILAGSGTAVEWKLENLSTIFPSPSAGSLLVGVIGAIGIIYLLTTLHSWRSWGIVVLGYLVDFSLTLVLIWPISAQVIADPLGLWPYILGSIATLLAGILVGLMARRATLSHVSGIVSLDLLLAGISGFSSPQALTWVLVSRVFVAYCVAFMGASIGRYARHALLENPDALGKFIGTTLLELLVATVAGILAVVILK